MTSSELIETSLERYIAEVGPEPRLDRKKPDMEAQYRAWKDWWLEWYRRPLQPGEVK